MDPVKKRIQELVPDVMKRTFGYQVRVLSNSHLGNDVFKQFGERLFWLGGENLKYYCSKGWIEFHLVRELERKNSIEHLGLPITLTVVLRAFEATFMIFANMDPKDQVLIAAENMKEIVMHWDLKKDSFDEQNQEAQKFIGKLLGI